MTVVQLEICDTVFLWPLERWFCSVLFCTFLLFLLFFGIYFLCGTKAHKTGEIMNYCTADRNSERMIPSLCQQQWVLWKWLLLICLHFWVSVCVCVCVCVCLILYDTHTHTPSRWLCLEDQCKCQMSWCTMEANPHCLRVCVAAQRQKGWWSVCVRVCVFCTAKPLAGQLYVVDWWCNYVTERHEEKVCVEGGSYH